MSDQNTRDLDVENIIADVHSSDSAVVAEEEEEIKIYEPKSKKNDGVSENTHTTKVLDFMSRKSAKKAEKQAEAMPELDGQMTFEGMEPEPPSEQPAEEEAPVDKEQEIADKLQDARREKVENFRLIQNDEMGFRLAGDGDDEDETIEDDSGVTEDYNSYAETAAVRGELYYRRRTGRNALLFACALEFLLLCVALLAGVSPALPMRSITYLTVNLVLLCGIMLTAHRVISDGFGALVRLSAAADSVTAVAAFAAAIHTVLQYLNLTGVANGEVVLYNAAAGLSLVLAMCGRQYRLSRICRNFRLVSSKGEKYAATCVTQGKQREQFGRFIHTLTAPKAVYLKKSEFLSHFMANSYGDEGHESLFRWFSPVLIGLSLLFSLGYAFFGSNLGVETANWWSAIGLFTSLLCAGAPAFAVAGANLPLCSVGRYLLGRGAALIGWETARDFSDVNALLVDASDIFPEETVLLHGIKTFAGARIDEAILDAAAISIEAGGPLAGVFRRVIEDRLDMLQDVDTLLYEQEMGLSGWVGGRRVLVGNRRLLENHGVDVPSRDYEMRYTKDNRQLVYLSTGGELCAMFVVSYTAKAEIGEALHTLTNSGTSLLVRTFDPNITESLLHEVFDVDSDAVCVLDTSAGRVYEALTVETAAETEAGLVCNGRFEGVGMAIGLARRIFSRVRTTGLLQMVGAGTGFLLTALAAAAQAPLGVTLLLLNTGLWSGITWVVAHIWSKK